MANESDRPAIPVGGNVGDRNVIGDHNIVDSFNTINEAPPPELKVLKSEPITKVAEGIYTARTLVHVVSPYAASMLTVTARNKDLLGVALVPEGSGATSGGGTALRDGEASEYVQAPSGKYWAITRASTAVPTDLEFTLE